MVCAGSIPHVGDELVPPILAACYVLYSFVNSPPGLLINLNSPGGLLTFVVTFVFARYLKYLKRLFFYFFIYQM